MKTPIRSFGSLALLFLTLSSQANGQTIDALWGQTAGPVNRPIPNYNMASSLAKDEQGYVYVAGTLQGTTSFGATVVQVDGSQNAFLAKYSPQGEVVWVKGIIGPGLAEDVQIAVNATSVYVTGQFRGELYFNSGGNPVSLIGPEAFSAAGSSVSGFVAKYDAETASLDWVKPILGTLSGDGVITLEPAPPTALCFYQVLSLVK